MFTIWVCVDCMFEHHYPGEYAGSTGKEWCNYPDAKMGDITAGISCDKGECHYWEDEEEHSEECATLTFSRSRCDGCGSTLGGTRHAFTIWEEGE